MVRHQFATAKTPWIMGDRVFNHLKRAEGLYPVDDKDNRLNLATTMAKLLHVQEMLVAGRIIRAHYERGTGATPPWGQSLLPPAVEARPSPRVRAGLHRKTPGRNSGGGTRN
jgi:hypothetical protein